MKPSKYLFLVVLFSMLNFVFVRSRSTKQNATDISADNILDNNVTSSISEVSVTTEENGTDSTEYENVQTTEEDSNCFIGKIPKTSTIANIKEIDEDLDYIKGYFGGYYFNGTENNHYLVHGKYQTPSVNYYKNYNHTLEDNSSLGYYLGYALLMIDHTEYFRHHNFTHYNIHHYFYLNSTMLPEQYVGSDHLIFCDQNTSNFCPENTEAICLLNATIWCATKNSFVKPCGDNDVKNCVTTRIPCIKSDDSNCHRSIEVLEMPCISNITILDVNEDKRHMTFQFVAGTFILSPVLPLSERSLCVTVVAEPGKDLPSL